MARPTTQASVNWERVARATVHPLKIAVLDALAERGGEKRSPNELAIQFGESVNTVAYHVRSLADAGLIKCVDTRQKRGATEHFYGLVED